MLVGQKLALAASQNGSAIAFKYLGQSTSYRDAFKYVNRYSYFLQNEIMHNNRVLVYMSNCPHLAYTFFALANTKNTAVFADPKRPEMEIANLVRDLGISAIIVSDDYVKVVNDLVRNNHLNNVKIIQCETRRWGEYDETYRLPPNMSGSDKDVVALFETSGTWGHKKMVPYTHTMIESAALSLKAGYRPSSIDTFWVHDATLGHSFYFIHGLMFPLFNGNTVGISDLRDPADLVPWLNENKITRVLMDGQKVEGFFKGIIDANLKFATIRSVTPFHFHLKEEVVASISKQFNNTKFLNAYGSTETSWSIGMTSFEQPEPFHTAGKIFSTVKTRMINLQGDDVPETYPQIGQIICSGPMVAKEYYNSKEDTKLQMRGGWFFTGDWAEVDKKKNLQILDRAENICSMLGNTIVAPKVEAAFMKLAGVVDAGYIMMKEGQKKLVPLIVIQKQKSSTLSRDEVLEYAKGCLKDFEVPRHVAFVDEMPKNSWGLTDRFKLRYEFGGDEQQKESA